MRLRLLTSCRGFVVASLGAMSSAVAAPPAIAPAGSGQGSLGVGFDAAGELRARLCADAACSVEGGVKLGVPAEFAKQREKTKLAVVGIGLGRRAIVVTVPGARADKRWEAVVAAPLAGNAPVVAFAGVTGYSTGEDGMRHGAMVTISEPESDGARRVLVGEQHEELTLCGRATMLGPRLLDPKDLTLKSAKVQRLDSAERERAPRLSAERVPATAPPQRPLLRALGATSAVGNPAALSDGNLETTWAENRGGSGRGEFVVFRAPSGVPLHGVELAVRPQTAAVTKGVSPRELWVATTKSLYFVTLPDDGFREPGTRYTVRFPESVQDDCVAIALESAFGERPDAEVTLAEVSVTTGLDSIDLPSVVDALAGGGQRAEQAKPLLRALGEPAYAALVARFDALGDNARLDALDVLDAAPCATSAPAYAKALASKFETHWPRASERLRRCGPSVSAPLAEALPEAKGDGFQRLASEFAEIAPEQALTAFVPLFTEADVVRRRALRVALGRASRLPRAVPAFQKALAEPSLPETALLDILRALGDRAPAYLPLSGAALARLGGDKPSFRVRFLRLGTAGALSSRDAGARTLLMQGLADTDPRLRVQAIDSLREASVFQNELVARLADPSVRVRMAAARVLAGAPNGPATPALLRLVSEDPWPAVRALSVAALGGARPDPALDERLAQALEDTSPVVRRALLLSLGARGARAQAGVVLERVSDRDEAPEVRTAAARVLGELCSEEGLSVLTKHARLLADPFASTEQRALSVAALGSLARIGPKNLASRLDPLLDESAPPMAKAAARSALETRPACGQRR